MMKTFIRWDNCGNERNNQSAFERNGDINK